MSVWKGPRTKDVSVGCSVTLSDGREVDVSGECRMALDPNYGADADGRRGVPRWFREQTTVEEVTDSDTGDRIAWKELTQEDQDCIRNGLADAEPSESYEDD